MYRLTAQAEIHLDDYEQGQLEHRNSYTLPSQDYNSLQGSLQAYIEWQGLDYAKDNIVVDGELIYTSYLVDADSTEATREQVEKWKKGKLELYDMTLYFIIEDITRLTIGEIDDV